MTISIIIPVFRDNEALSHLLAEIRSWPQQPHEILVVDGADDESCKSLCEQHQAQYLPSEPCRGAQQHHGAKQASDDIFWFLHADSRPDVASLDHIQQAVKNGAVGGFFRFRFFGPRSFYQRLTEGMVYLRGKLGVVYGDQGIFVTRDAYFKAGGFQPMPLFEERPLTKALRRQGIFAELDQPIGVSSRRWIENGWIRHTLHNWALQIAYALGISPETLVKRYRNRGKHHQREDA